MNKAIKTYSQLITDKRGWSKSRQIWAVNQWGSIVHVLPDARKAPTFGDHELAATKLKDQLGWQGSLIGGHLEYKTCVFINLEGVGGD